MGVIISASINTQNIMKNTRCLLALGLAVSGLNAAADPILTCWQTNYAGQYARVFTNAAMQSAGTALTTWSNGS
jgi:hypothetical protein